LLVYFYRLQLRTNTYTRVTVDRLLKFKSVPFELFKLASLRIEMIVYKTN